MVAGAASRGKIDAAGAAGSGSGEASAEAGREPGCGRGSTDSRRGAGRALRTFRLRVRLARDPCARDGAVRSRKPVPGEPGPSRKCDGRGAGTGVRTEVGVSARGAAREWGGCRPDPAGPGVSKMLSPTSVCKTCIS